MLVIKLVSERTPDRRVLTRVFMGEKGFTLQCAGTLYMTIGEWQLHGAALMLGATKTHGRLKVICEGDAEVVKHDPMDDEP